MVTSPRLNFGAPPSFTSQCRPQNKHQSFNYTNSTIAAPTQSAYKRKQPPPSPSPMGIGINQRQIAHNNPSTNKRKQQNHLSLMSPIKRLRVQDSQSKPSTSSPASNQGECKFAIQVPKSQAHAGHRPTPQTINNPSGFSQGKSLQLSLIPLRG